MKICFCTPLSHDDELSLVMCSYQAGLQDPLKKGLMEQAVVDFEFEDTSRIHDAARPFLYKDSLRVHGHPLSSGVLETMLFGSGTTLSWDHVGIFLMFLDARPVQECMSASGFEPALPLTSTMAGLMNQLALAKDQGSTVEWVFCPQE